ncbi:hypothetical protein MCW82_07145 [Azospirillum doebereinerae]|uniref:hypothetical protein n=1 Tax=Azospirillum doebereinerae TaxID=92933 RepID=UPI001EE56199|nr:hypothetical protein [Azospirillum doebereinerae]MCG5239543.1 hypothetical protein [Azospirillum doebereinerae]
MDDLSARVLAFHFMASTDRRADDVYRMCRRLLGHRETRREARAVWSDAFDLLVVLIADSETFAAGIRRRVLAAGRRSECGLDRERERAWA